MYNITRRGEIYYCECRTQDSTERWEEKTKEKAYQEMIKAAHFWNGSHIIMKDITYSEAEAIPVKSPDEILLEAIKRGEKIVLDCTNPLIRKKISESDSNIICRLREGSLFLVNDKGQKCNYFDIF